jgi:hypothetical protein
VGSETGGVDDRQQNGPNVWNGMGWDGTGVKRESEGRINLSRITGEEYEEEEERKRKREREREETEEKRERERERNQKKRGKK